MSDAELLERAESISDRITALRRAIHREPELGLQTPKTMAKAREELADLPLEWREGPSTTGAVATLKGAKPGRQVLLRGDMDALPMDEHTELEFASTIAGRMHACGHDAHTAMLAGAARILAEQADTLAGEVQFMFQPGEEGYHGAQFMIDDGLLDPLPDAAFALHVMPRAPFGVIAGRPGPMLAAADQFEITVKGQGGHASMPHDTRDPVPVAAEVITALQTLVTRRFDAAKAVVITISQMDAGSAHNIIADTATLKGTIRTLSPEYREEAQTAMETLASGIASAHGLTAEVVIERGFPVTMNDPRAVEIGRVVTHDVLGEGQWRDLPDPIMGAEDFAYVLEKVPGAMFFLGVAQQGSDWTNCCGIHSSRMMVDEAAMPKGAAILAACAIRVLRDGIG